MVKFILGMIFGVLVVAGGAYYFLEHGYVNFGADSTPSDLESKIAMGAVDAWTDRSGGDEKNPLQTTEENLTAGATLYLNHCAGCHGLPSNPDSQFRRSFYPPAPGFYREMPDMEDTGNFHIIKHGIRWTGMPAWGSTLSDQQIWQVVLFFDNMHKLPPAAAKVLESPAASPATGK
jgi:mono/diheme cytochrome c family protein